MALESKKKLVFALNGERFELATVDPNTTLLEFLRTQTRYKGAKLGCGEGGCGACVVLLARYDPKTDQVTEFSVSSCLTLLCSIHLCAVTTVEGIGSKKDGFHSIQQRFAGFHASQCGFCTPGMCMSLFSAIVKADKTERPEPPDGFSKLTVSEAEKAIAGNMCRCTGYRPIVDTCKSFAADVDLEDLGLNAFWKKGEKCADSKKLPYYSRGGICTFPDSLKSEIKSSVYHMPNSIQKDSSDLTAAKSDVLNNINDTSLADSCWYRPSCVDGLQSLLNSLNECRVKMVAGNTGSGVYKELDLYDKYIDIRSIPELNMIRRDNTGIEFGAAVTISKAIEVLKEETESLVFVKIANHMSKVASQFVRNTASLGGNLILAQRNQFASDIATVLLAVSSIVSIQKASKRQVLTLEEFLEIPPCDKTLLLSIHIPCWYPMEKPSSGVSNSVDSKPTRESTLLFETYRASPRPLGNAVAYVNSAFLAQVSSGEVSGNVIDDIQLAFGAYGSEHATRARNVEKFIIGKPVTATVLLEAIRLLSKTIVPKEGIAHSAYRSSLVVAFLFKFLAPLAKDLVYPSDNSVVHIPNGDANTEYTQGSLNGYCTTSLDKALETVAIDHLDNSDVHIPNGDANTEYTQGSLNGYRTTSLDKALETVDIDHLDNHKLLLSSKQMVGSGRESRNYCPVGEPIAKSGAELQASGEAIFVDDIPSPKDCLYGAFICGTKPLACVKGIKFKSALASQKVVTVISTNDIPKGGKNIGTGALFGDERLFADPVTDYAGQPLGVVVAETQRLAVMAARQAIVDYGTEYLGEPILSVEDAVRKSSFFEIPPYFRPKQVGDFSRGMEEADHKILSAEVKLRSQYYFYMETQTALAIPDEDNCMVVYSSTQCPENAQKVIAKCLGIPFHNVRVITRRVGGGFGGKAVRSIPVAVACALAAYKLRRPVRMYLDRKTDMLITGGRHPMKIKYSVGFNSDGKITALHIDLLINAGFSEDISPIIAHNITESLKKYNWGALSFEVKVCKTNLSSKSAMRAPGEVQGSFIAEAVMEHVASVLSVDPSYVRKKNLHTFESLKTFYEGSAGEGPEYTLPSIFDEVMVSAGYYQRVEMIQKFNSHSKWRKRGISCVPIVHQVMLMARPGKVGILNDGSVVVEVGGIELGQGLWTKVKQMTAFALGQLWDDGSQDLLDRVRIIQADTLSLIQGGWTAGSTTSESSCEAVRIACNVLVDRLKSLKDSLQEKMGSISWDNLIVQASLQSLNLSASSFWVPDVESVSYLNYGVAVSEVEVDLLTGATTILRTDLTYDCGQSLNPAVDLGQIEGAFVQGIGFFMNEEYLVNADGLTTSDGTWTYKIPTVDTIPKEFNVELLNSGNHQKRILSSKASGEPPLLLSASVHCATRHAIKAAREEHYLAPSGSSPSAFQLDVPAIMPVVKELCGLDIIERYLESSIRNVSVR